MIGAEPVALSFQFRLKLGIIVNLAIEDDTNRAILVKNWLLPRLKVDDGEPAHAERYIDAFPKPSLVGTAMDDDLSHPP
jgi:hypothetical protein